jgi:hypothetical protein
MIDCPAKPMVMERKPPVIRNPVSWWGWKNIDARNREPLPAHARFAEQCRIRIIREIRGVVSLPMPDRDPDCGTDSPFPAPLRGRPALPVALLK